MSRRVVTGQLGALLLGEGADPMAGDSVTNSRHDPVRVIVADDDESIRIWLRHLIEVTDGLELVGQADTTPAAVELARVTQPHIAVVDVQMPGGGGAEGARLIGAFSPDTRVLAFSAYDLTAEVLAMIEAGARGYVVKSGDDREVVDAIRAVAAGSVYFSSGVDFAVVAHLRDTLVSGNQQALQRSRVVNLVEDVLAREALESHYQPIVDLVQNRIVGYEALARIQSERRQPPDVWFAEADRIGRLAELELLAIRSAVAALPLLRGDEFLAINISPQTALGSVLSEALGAAPVHRVVLEITEHAEVSDYTRLFQALYPLRSRGLRLAIDDVGAGYASMAHVLHLAPEIIKLDRSLTAGIDRHHHRQSLVDKMRDFAAETGAALLAEGIETQAELDTVRALGVSLGQGYLLGRPQPITDVVAVPTSRQ